MNDKEQLAYRYWMASYHQNMDKRQERKQVKAEREELSSPHHMIGIINDEGQWEIVQAQPVNPTLKLLPEVLGFMLFFFVTFAFAETYIGALL